MCKKEQAHLCMYIVDRCPVRRSLSFCCLDGRSACDDIGKERSHSKLERDRDKETSLPNQTFFPFLCFQIREQDAVRKKLEAKSKQSQISHQATRDEEERMAGKAAGEGGR